MKSSYIYVCLSMAFVLHLSAAEFDPKVPLEHRLARHIVAIGGGKITDPTQPSDIRRYILNLVPASERKPKICVLPQARVGFPDYHTYIANFTCAFEKEGAEVSCLDLGRCGIDVGEIEQQLYEQDVIYVGGGNTRNMLALWAAWGIDTILFRAYQKGIVLAGASAGALCWFQHGVTDSAAPLAAIDGLGILAGTCCPHHDSELDRQQFVTDVLPYCGASSPTYALDDYTAIHVASDVYGEIFRTYYLKWRSAQEYTNYNEVEFNKRSVKVSYDSNKPLVPLTMQELYYEEPQLN